MALLLHNDEFFLASIPLLSAICRSATNVDKTDQKFQVNYLCKYIAGVEEHRLVEVTGTKDISEVKVTTEDHAHEKITGCKKILSQKEEKKPHHGREVSLTEVVWFALGLPYTYCNANFVHVPTLPLENRVGVLRHSRSISTTSRDDSAVTGRVTAGLPEWRQFTANQEVHIEDYRRSPYWCDATSSFNIRPPELLFFNDLQLYCECFVIVGRQPCSFNNDLGSQLWFDGLSRRVLLRSCSIPKAISFASQRANSGDTRAASMLRRVLIPIFVDRAWFP